MTILKNACALALLIGCLSFAVDHHGWSSYDQTKTLDYKGTVQELKYENPHALATVKDKDKTWTVYLAPITRMEARGLNADMIKKGTTIRVVGYPHKETKDEMRAERIYVGDNKYELR
jgi:hypothetical protein